jgi:tetratricopeptide (TPR) repeat protein
LGIAFLGILFSLVACRPSSPNDDAKARATAAAPSASPMPGVDTPTAAASAVPPLRGRPRTRAEFSTTDPRVHAGNLDGLMREATRLYDAAPTDVARCRTASGMYASMGKLRGDLDLIQRSIDVAAKCIALHPDDAQSYLERATPEQSLHRFALARTDLDKARALGGEPDAIRALLTELDWNDGRYEQAIAAIRAARRERPTMMTVAREAQLAHDLGDMNEADRLFEAAEDLVRDTSPVPLAWLYLQRGMHLVAGGRLDEAIVFFRASVDRFPSVAEREHLAETLHLRGLDDEATSIYEAIVAESRDPEFMGALASIYRAHGRGKEADLLKAKATARYGELLVAYPEAMYWHASEYFMGEGADTKRAQALLEKNHALRPNSVSLVALARAKLANGDVTGAKGDIEKALAMPVVSALLYATAARVYTLVKDEGKHAEYASKARTLDAHIGEAETPLR